MPVSEREPGHAVGSASVGMDRDGPRATTRAADLTPTAAWSRRVRWIGGLIQAAFAAFWLVRGSVVLGGRAADVFDRGLWRIVIGVFFYAIRRHRHRAAAEESGGQADRAGRDGRHGHRVRRGVRPPVVVVAAGHSDWVLPSIAITIGPLLLCLDHHVHVPRYRPVGWALTVGPVILVATMSGTALVATTGIAAGCCCSVPPSPASTTSRSPSSGTGRGQRTAVSPL